MREDGTGSDGRGLHGWEIYWDVGQCLFVLTELKMTRVAAKSISLERETSSKAGSTERRNRSKGIAASRR